MPEGSSPKRERQYEHIKESYEERGKSEEKAEELAARTVNKQRADAGETKSSRRAKRKSGGGKPKRSRRTDRASER